MALETTRSGGKRLHRVKVRRYTHLSPTASYIIDMVCDRWLSIDVLPTGWRVLDESPVRFWRSAPMRPLPMPSAGGDYSLLWRFANIPERDRPLVLAWILESWRADTPFTVLELCGQQGTAKSSTQDKLRRVIDPNAVNLRSAPKTVEDIFVGAGCNWLVSFNNISHLSGPQQDALCTLATGGGFASRRLYTNDEESLIECKRPVVVNGITPNVTAQDLTDRVIHVELLEIEYLEESVIESDFINALPSILGGLLDLFVQILKRLPDVRIQSQVRMADFARLGEAMMITQNQPAGTFMSLYRDNRKQSITRGIDASPVAASVRDMVEGCSSRLVFKGNMKDLLKELDRYKHVGDAWPKSPRGLSDALRRQRPGLRAIGIDAAISSHGREGVVVTIRKHDPHEDGVRDSVQSKAAWPWQESESAGFR